MRVNDLLDWDKLILIGMNARSAKVKKETGCQPRYRELLGAVVLMALKKFDYRQAEDMIAHYAPARYLCDFTKMLGAEGMETINQEVLTLAQSIGFLNCKQLMSDTTAQEAKSPYPTEVGLMSGFVIKIKKHLTGTGKACSKVKGLARNCHLFCKDKASKVKVSTPGGANPLRNSNAFGR